MPGPFYGVSLKEFIDKVPDFVNAVKKRVARELFFAIVNNEGKTPYKTGSYISSHRIGIGEPDITDVVVKEGAVTADQAKASVLARQLPRLSVNMGVEDDIHISNSVGVSESGYSWARNVEYEGWPGGTGPYMIYERALQKVEPQIPKYVSEIVNSMKME